MSSGFWSTTTTRAGGWKMQSGPFEKKKPKPTPATTPQEGAQEAKKKAAQPIKDAQQTSQQKAQEDGIFGRRRRGGKRFFTSPLGIPGSATIVRRTLGGRSRLGI